MKSQKFRDEHREISNHIKNIQNLMVDIPKNSDRIAKALSNLSGILKIHLATEDNLLYPKLIESSDQYASSMAKKFQTEMSDVTKQWEIFINYYGLPSRIKKNSKNFETDIIETFSSLANRINKEESILYPIYDDI